ncbi:DUF4097 family beta strand repeat-containing protein [Streptomyces sp. NPDC048603]|uniref:DUF4097 family beta strand repeat-containing protein n=1 Tax=Streptomyces sp. NPDC048603 TaxID=3365577 RepID=UPI00371DFA7B
MQQFATTTAVSAVLEIPAGRIRFIAADRTDTTVEVLPVSTAKSADVKAAERTEVSYADGVLRITAPEAGNKAFGQSGAVEVTVQLPAGSRVRARTAAAELRGVGRLGEVVFESAQGTVKLDETAGARVTLQSGDISVGLLAGPAQITTLKGDLNIAEARQGVLTLRTEHGDITVGAARGVSATLDAGTSYGRILNSLGNTDGPAAALHIDATTTYGNITARSA